MDCLFFPVKLDACTSSSSSLDIVRLTEHETSLLLKSRPNVNNTQFFVLTIIRLISRRSSAIPQSSYFGGRGCSPPIDQVPLGVVAVDESQRNRHEIELIKTLLFLNWFWLCVRVSLFLLKITQRLNRGMTLISGTEIWHWGDESDVDDGGRAINIPRANSEYTLWHDDTLTTSGWLLNTWNYYHLLQFPLNYNRTGHLNSMGSDPDSRRV